MRSRAELVQILEHYLEVSDEVREVDCLLVFGTFDDRVPRWASSILPTTRSRLVIISGDRGEHTRAWATTEHEAFSELVVAPAGVTVLIEPTATNTRENVTASLAVASHHLPVPTSWGLVSRALQSRRCKATFEAASSVPAYSFPAPGTFQAAEYGGPLPYARRVIAELDRLDRYAHLGHLVASPRPDAVEDALEELRPLVSVALDG